MSEKASTFKIGLFVLVAVALLLTGLAMLGAGSFLKKTTLVETYFDGSVNGLEVGAPLKHRGVTIGRVHKIGFAGQSYATTRPSRIGGEAGFVRVLLAIDPEYSKVITNTARDAREAVDAGLRVQPAQTGLVGGLFLDLTFVDPAENPPLKVDWVPEHPYIPSIPSRVERIASAAERVALALERADLNGLFARINELVRRIDRGVAQADIGKIAKDLESTLANARGVSQQLSDQFERGPLATALTDLPAIVDRGKSIANRLDSIAADPAMDDLPEAIARMKSVATRMDELLADPALKQAIGKVDTGVTSATAAATDMRRLAKRLDMLVASQEEDLEMIIAGLRRVLDNAGDLASDVRQNPSRLLLGAEPPQVNPAETRGRP